MKADLRKIKQAADVTAGMAVLLDDVAEGSITPSPELGTGLDQARGTFKSRKDAGLALARRGLAPAGAGATAQFGHNGLTHGRRPRLVVEIAQVIDQIR